MKRAAIIISLIALACGSGWLAFTQLYDNADTLEDGYVALFNGKSLEGWRKIGGDATYAVENGDIVGRHGPGQNTFLRTEATYANFSLKMDMRWDEPGNSGVLFRSAQRDSNGRAYGYQYELDPSERAWSGGIYDEARRGWLANLEDNPEARAAIRLTEWNEIEVAANGASLKTWLNGVPVADIVDGLDGSGFIALQVHAGNSGIIRWRNIRIKELPYSGEPGPTLLSADQWRSGDPEITANGLAVASENSAGWLITKREFEDALLTMTLPTCEQPTTVQVRSQPGEGDSEGAGVTVQIYADKAIAGMSATDRGQRSNTVGLPRTESKRLIVAMRGTEIVLTLDETDVIRETNSAAPKRGQLRIKPGKCGERFEISDLTWSPLQAAPQEPLFYESLDNEPAPALTPDESLAAFRIAPGYEIELVAAEPLVEDPVAMAWDEWGRLYVVEMRGYMPDAYGNGSEEPVGQIVRLEDTDGDGRMDKSEVFLSGLVNPRAVAVVNEGILIGEPPTLWLCELKQRKDLCTQRKNIGGYATDVGAANVEHMENGLRQGLDNWLYNSKSDRSLRLRDDNLLERRGPFRGQWGITRDSYGRWFYNHNSTWIQADFFQGEDLRQPGAHAGAQGLGVNLTNPAPVYSSRVNPGVNRAYLEGTLRPDGRLAKATGVSGLVYYRGDQFPEALSDHIYVPEVAGNVVAQFSVIEEGMALKVSQQLFADSDWGQRDFLTSTDERFRPVDAMNGPDGALYIIDMYRGIVQEDHFLTDELREQIFQRKLDTPVGMGRIWRITHTKGERQSSSPSLGDAAPGTLLSALSDTNGWTRETAQRLLLAHPGNLGKPLFQIAIGSETIPALHAIWTLEGRRELTRQQVIEIIASGDPQRQIQALRAGRNLLSASDLTQFLDSETPITENVATQVAFTLGDHVESATTRQQLSALLKDHAQSSYVRQAAIDSVTGQEFQYLQELLESDTLAADTESNRDLILKLARNAYLTMREDTTSEEIVKPEFMELLTLAESRSGIYNWQQEAILSGYAKVTVAAGFVPAHFASAPSIFADTDISETSPLWGIRLQARRAFTWPGDELAMGVTPLSPEQLALKAKGEVFYSRCAACHGDTGGGVSGLAPALADASWVTGPHEWLGRIILQGMSGPIEVNGEAFDGLMPAHGHLAELDNETLAGLMTYMRRSWGNKADPVTAGMAADVRKATATRQSPWTAEELQAVPFDRGYGGYIGKYSVSFVKMHITEETDGLYIDVSMYGSGKLEPVTGSDTAFTADLGTEKASLDFIVNDGDVASGFIMHAQGQRIEVARVED